MKNHYHRGRRRRHTARWVVLIVVCALAVAIGSIGAVTSYLNSHRAGTQPYTQSSPIRSQSSLPTVSPTPSQTPTPTSVARQCQAGWPKSFSWPDLGIKDAPIEAVAMGQNAPDAPASKNTIAMVKTGTLFDNKTSPALPGQGYGNVIAEGHTYFDNSAVFKEDAGTHVKEGSVFWFDMDNGSRCEYQVTKFWTKLAKGDPKPGQQTFTDVATEERFYEPHPGREQVLIMTCDDKVDPATGHHSGEMAALAVPTN